MLTAFKKSLLCRFTGTGEGPATQYLGCQLIRDRKHRVSALVQSAYAERLLRTFEMWDAHPIQTPLAPGLRLIKADCPARYAIDPALYQRYRSIVGSIGYLVQMTRCDLAFSQIGQLLYCPWEAHMAAAERVLRYIRGTHDRGLIFCDPGPERRNILYGWVDSGFAADPDTRQSMTGYVMAVNGAPISWCSCRQGGLPSCVLKLNMLLLVLLPKKLSTLAHSLLGFVFLNVARLKCGKTMPRASLSVKPP